MTALQKLHLADVVDVMNQANTEFEAMFVQRLEQFSQHDTSKELVQLVTEAYRTLVQHVEARATLTPSEAYTSLIKHMNKNIDHFNKVTARRKSMAAVDTATVDTAESEETNAEMPADEQIDAPTT